MAEGGRHWPLWVGMNRAGPGAAVSRASSVPGSGRPMPLASETPTAEPMTA